MNLEVGAIAAVWSSIFANFRLYYVSCAIMVYNITF
jgi:hypothetical protein